MHKICYEKDISQLKNLTIKIFRILGVKFSNDELDFIINKYSKEKVNSIGKNIIKTNQQKQFKLNATSGFHENHFFDGKSDKYIDFLDTTTIRLLANQTKEIADFLNIDSKSKDAILRPFESHTIQGNPIRLLKKEVKIRYDDRFRKRLTKEQFELIEEIDSRITKQTKWITS